MTDAADRFDRAVADVQRLAVELEGCPRCAAHDELGAALVEIAAMPLEGPALFAIRRAQAALEAAP